MMTPVTQTMPFVTLMDLISLEKESSSKWPKADAVPQIEINVSAARERVIGHEIVHIPLLDIVEGIVEIVTVRDPDLLAVIVRDQDPLDLKDAPIEAPPKDIDALDHLPQEVPFLQGVDLPKEVLLARQEGLPLPELAPLRQMGRRSKKNKSFYFLFFSPPFQLWNFQHFHQPPTNKIPISKHFSRMTRQLISDLNKGC